MAAHKIEFQGKDVAEAIRNACKSLKVSQEELDIEVLNTGSCGIFGLGKKKVRLLVSRKKGLPAVPTETPFEAAIREEETQEAEQAPGPVVEARPQPAKAEKAPSEPEAGPVAGRPGEEKNDQPAVDVAVSPTPDFEVSPELCDEVKVELTRMLELMGYPSQVAVRPEEGAVFAHITGEYEDEIVGPEGRVLDGLQYLVRKMVGKRYSDKLIISLDAGEFRTKRLQELDGIARKMAEDVRKNGKTKAIQSLNPSERRIVHMALQGDKDIRSRSVGEGLFKKVLIFRPGRGKKGGPRRRRSSPKNKTA